MQPPTSPQWFQAASGGPASSSEENRIMGFSSLKHWAGEQKVLDNLPSVLSYFLGKKKLEKKTEKLDKG